MNYHILQSEHTNEIQHERHSSSTSPTHPEPSKGYATLTSETAGSQVVHILSCR